MTLPYQEHNSLISSREFLVDLTNPEKIPGVPEKVRLNAAYLLKYYPSRLRLDELYDADRIQDLQKTKVNDESSNRIMNDNQTWETPGFKWKTEVEFIPTKEN